MNSIGEWLKETAGEQSTGTMHSMLELTKSPQTEDLNLHVISYTLFINILIWSAIIFCWYWMPRKEINKFSDWLLATKPSPLRTFKVKVASNENICWSWKRSVLYLSDGLLDCFLNLFFEFFLIVDMYYIIRVLLIFTSYIYWTTDYVHLFYSIIFYDNKA